MAPDTYKTLKSSSEGIYKEKGSRFVALATPVTCEEEIRKVLEKVRKDRHDARHHCYAYMLGHDRKNWRVNDDGEPSGTAGKPILGQINSKELTNIIITVSRYFGGRLLGVSGLLNAYRSAAASALQNVVIEEMTLREYYKIVFPYNSLNDAMRVLKEEETGQTDQFFGLECSIVINFRVSAKEKILARLSRIEGITIDFIAKH